MHSSHRRLTARSTPSAFLSRAETAVSTADHPHRWHTPLTVLGLLALVFR
jgi:hypothetical protein